MAKGIGAVVSKKPAFNSVEGIFKYACVTRIFSIDDTFPLAASSALCLEQAFQATNDLQKVNLNVCMASEDAEQRKVCLVKKWHSSF